MRNLYFIYAIPPEADLTPVQIAAIPNKRKKEIQLRMQQISQAITPLAEDTAEFAAIVADSLSKQFPGVKFCVAQTIATFDA